MSTQPLNTQIEVDFVLADVSDLPSLAEIQLQAYNDESINRFAFTNWPDPANMLTFYKYMLKQRFASSSTRVFKAVESSTGEILGFMCWTLERGDDEEEKTKGNEEADPLKTMMQELPPCLKMDFLKATAPEFEKLKNIMKGPRHYYISAFAVAPKFQGKGIGSRLLMHCLDIVDDEGLATWLTAVPGSHALYLRFGFEDRGFFDIDLNEWDGGRCKGFGAYRSYAMCRAPREEIFVRIDFSFIAVLVAVDGRGAMFSFEKGFVVTGVDDKSHKGISSSLLSSSNAVTLAMPTMANFSQLHKFLGTSADGQGNFPCPEASCQKVSPSLRSASNHWYLVHRDPTDKPHKCDAQGCDKSYTTTFGLRRHINDKHPSEDYEQKWECREWLCEKHFIDKRELAYHEGPEHEMWWCPMSDCDWNGDENATVDDFIKHRATHSNQPKDTFLPKGKATKRSREEQNQEGGEDEEGTGKRQRLEEGQGDDKSEGEGAI
ncbi:hypothetical protein G7Y89_g11744 [Cudoniella acicularis]|uniref:C2H2-type domain-containing protein n=1 Tax=Cudoniella acicularis TaxID=354080 RepID=A0A8H4VZV6_9HELO|nr:hypothetical protein G7Y89_g11744 [Cudoniella acicularis]